VKFVVSNGVIRDFGQGSLHRTDAPLDLAIDGRGFFQVQTPDGPRYTRDGRFRLDDQAQLVAAGGQPVLDDGGGPITLDPTKGPVTIAPDGTVSQGTGKDMIRVARVGVVDFSDLSGLQKTGDNLYRNGSNLQPTPVTDARIRQGMLESSNVNPILEITRMIEVSRAYEQLAKMIDSQADLSTQAVQQLGKAA
jgi:flagellar basal-body rod protein FlgF